MANAGAQDVDGPVAQAVGRVATGGTYVSPALAEYLIEAAEDGAPVDPGLDLTPRERDRLDAELTRLERHIAQLKHNDETRRR